MAQYVLDLRCPRCGKPGQAVTTKSDIPPPIMCEVCIRTADKAVEMGIVQVTVSPMTPDPCPHCGERVPAPARRDEHGLFITHACDQCWAHQRQWKWDDAARARASNITDEGASK